MKVTYTGGIRKIILNAIKENQNGFIITYECTWCNENVETNIITNDDLEVVEALHNKSRFELKEPCINCKCKADILISRINAIEIV